MAIVDTINSIKVNVENAYTSLENKGATIPNQKNIQNLSSAIESIQAGGGDSPIQNSGGKYLVRVVDYDGTILKEDWLNTGATFALPNPPTHDRLIFEEWAGQIDIVDNVITVPNYDVIIGPLYNTKSGLTEVDIELTPATGLTITFNEGTTIDWGDGITDTSLTHTYANYGTYTIKPYFDFYSGSTSQILTSAQMVCIKNVFLGENVTYIHQKLFSDAYSLKNVTFHTKVDNLGAYGFQNCYSLNTIILGKTAYISNYCFYYSLSLENFAIQKGGSCGSNGSGYIFYYSGLKYLTVPMNSEENLGQAVFRAMYRLKRLNITTDMSSCGNNFFNNIYGAEEIRFVGATKVPTITTSSISTISKLTKIVVPDNLYDAWTGATNWVALYYQIYKLSEVQ